MRVAVSDIDTYRYYLDDEDGDFDKLLRRLRREEPETIEMRAGKALHRFLETGAQPGHTFGLSLDESILNTPFDDGYQSIDIDGFRFDFSRLEATLPLQPLREIKAEKEYIINGTSVMLVGKVDGMDGLAIDDHKFTTSYFTPDRYFDAYQWRLYLDIYEANRFKYNIFIGKGLGKEGKIETGSDGIARVKLTDFVPFPLVRYPELHADCLRVLGEYVEFAKRYLVPQEVV